MWLWAHQWCSLCFTFIIYKIWIMIVAILLFWISNEPYLEYLEHLLVQSKCYLRISYYNKLFFKWQQLSFFLFQCSFQRNLTTTSIKGQTLLPHPWNLTWPYHLLWPVEATMCQFCMSASRGCASIPSALSPSFHQRHRLRVACRRLGPTWARATSA